MHSGMTVRNTSSSLVPEAGGVERVNFRALAEGVILQAIEDFWNEASRKDSIEFFHGEGLRQWAAIGGISIGKQLKLIRMLKKQFRHSAAEHASRGKAYCAQGR